MRTSPDPPWYWKPWLRLPSVREFWQRPRPVRPRGRHERGGYEVLSERYPEFTAMRDEAMRGSRPDFMNLAMLSDLDAREGRQHIEPRPVTLAPMDPGDVAEGR